MLIKKSTARPITGNSLECKLDEQLTTTHVPDTLTLVYQKTWACLRTLKGADNQHTVRPNNAFARLIHPR